MPKTDKRVRITTDHPKAAPGRPIILVDGELLPCVTGIEFKINYSEGFSKVLVTMIGVDVDLEAAPEYLVRVVGPSPKSPEVK